MSSIIQSRRIVWLLRLLTAMGMTVVISTLTVDGIALWNVRVQRAALNAEQARLSEASDRLRRYSAQSRSEIQSTLDGVEAQSDVGTASVNLQRFIKSELDSHAAGAVLEPLAELDTLASKLTGLADRADDWRSDYEAVGSETGSDALRLRRDREKLKTEAALLFENIDTANARFAVSAEGRVGAMAAQMEQSLGAGWRRMLMFGCGCSLVFLWLAHMISRGIYGQVAVIDQSRAEAEKGRLITQKLMLEQQAAAAELEVVHKKLLETSRQAGMAEIATGVLHNVGNVLNSVNVSSSLLMETVRKSRLSHLARVAALLREHEADLGTFITSDPAGKQIPGFLAQLANYFDGEQAVSLKELGQLQKNIEHIKQIVAMQQAYAGASGFKEPVDLREMTEDALRIHMAAMTRHDIRIEKEFFPIPPVLADKHKVLQILVNLISNAKHAMKESPSKTLTIRIEAAAGHVRAIIRDTGYGIAPENLTRIFAHGFTTKKEGHGFGLHSGALAAKELGGSLHAASEGPGHGAVFTLELPAMNQAALAA